MLSKIKNIPIVLGSQSPRRQELLKSLDIDFEVVVKSIDETISSDIAVEFASEYIALKKLEAFKTEEFYDSIVITADTVVVDHFGRALGKPKDVEEAKSILCDLQDNTHIVFTGVAILFKDNFWSFTEKTQVTFGKLSPNEIDYYVSVYKPFDKAGSYGIQEWVGRVGIERIEGTYENVMGLPTRRLYKELVKIEKGL